MSKSKKKLLSARKREPNLGRSEFVDRVIKKQLFPSIKAACAAVDISCRAYYDWRTNRDKRQARKRRHKPLEDLLEAIWKKHRCIYGVPKLLEILRTEYHFEGSRYAVEQAAKTLGIRGCAGPKGRKKRRPSAPERESDAGMVNLFNRDFSAARPDQKYALDITEIPLIDYRKAYLCLIGDLYARDIVGWAVSLHHDSEVVVQALMMAFDKLDSQTLNGLSIHMDRGGENIAFATRQVLSERGITPSWSAVGSCADNAFIESLNAIFELEFIRKHPRPAFEDLAELLMSYITFYNEVRVHSYNKYSTPHQARAHYFKSVL